MAHVRRVLVLGLGLGLGYGITCINIGTQYEYNIH